MTTTDQTDRDRTARRKAELVAKVRALGFDRLADAMEGR